MDRKLSSESEISPNKDVLFQSFEKQEEFLGYVFDDKTVFVLYGGAIRGGKTYAALGATIILCLKHPGSRWAVVRKDRPTLKNNTLPAWEKIKPSMAIDKYNGETMTVTFKNKSQIIFFAENYQKDKDLNRWKGLEVNGFILEEINELQEATYNKAIERAGSWIIPKKYKYQQPKPLIIGTCNPTQGWVKEKVYNKWKEGALPPHTQYIQSTIFDNPYITEDYMNSLKNLPKYEYEVFVNGNWDVQLKVGGEFFKGFELADHVAPVAYDPAEPIHVSVDNNVWPYIAVTLWQLKKKGDGWQILQVGEVCARDPYNTATASARRVLRWLKRNDFVGPKVYLYGDPTTQARNTIDDNKKTFLDKFLDKLESRHDVQKRFFKKAPSVAATGGFINEVYENQLYNLEIIIGEDCKESINDYIETKENKDGGILKVRAKDSTTGITFEKNGHLSDTKRYFIIKCFYDEYRKYTRRWSNPEEYHIAKPNSVIRGGI